MNKSISFIQALIVVFPNDFLLFILLLTLIPSIHTIETKIKSENPTHTIIHIKNWNFIPFNLFKVDFRANDPEPITDEELKIHFEKFLKDIEEIQTEQKALLRHLKIKKVFVEGLTEEDLPFIKIKLDVMCRFSKVVEQVRQEQNDIEAKLDRLNKGSEEYRKLVKWRDEERGCPS